MNLRSKIIFAFAALAMMCPLSAIAQGVSSSGTEYYLGFMPNGPGGGRIRIELFIGTSTKNKIRISSAGTVKTYTVAPNSVLDVPFDQNSITTTSETPTDNAIHIQSDNPITVYGYSVWGSNNTLGGSPDGYLGLPVTAFGKEYYAVCYNDSQFGGFNSAGEFMVIAAYDNTSVTITTKGDTRDATKAFSHKAGSTFHTTLMKGQTYLVQGTAVTAGDNDLTGSHIVSDKPVGLLAGHEITPIILGVQTSADHLLEMMPPVDKWGTQYFDMPMAGRTQCGDYIRVLSAEDGNQITYNGKGPLLLNAGEYSERDLVTDPEVYTSINHKKFVVMQYSYSQGFNGDPGTADPFMILMTPQQQFEKAMLFRTPANAQDGSFNNYITFICQYDSIKKITINGKKITAYQYVGLQQFPATSPVMAAYRIKLPGGEQNYLAQGPSPFGAYQYGFSSYEGYGWPTGMATKIISPDTLPPLRVDLDNSCGNYHIKFNEPRTQANGFSFDDTHIASISLITDTGDSRWATPSFNYSFALDPSFIIGDSVTTGMLTINDPSQDGYAALYAVDRAGNDTVYQYRYNAPRIAVTPADSIYQFGDVLYGSDSCRTLTFTNIQAAGDFFAQFDSLKGIAVGGSFSVTPKTLTNIPVGKSVDLNVCFHAADTGKVSLDSLVFQSRCVPYIYPVRGTGVTPLIYTEDLAFGSVDSGLTKCLPLKISNIGKYPLTVTKQDLASDPNFSVDPAQTFPIVIQPHQSVTLQYCFHPQSTGSFQAHVRFSNLNPGKFAHSVKDTSLLTGFALGAGAKLTTYLKDFGLPSCSATPIMYDTLYNDLPAAKVITNVQIIGPDAKYFTIVSTPPSYPFALIPNQKVPYDIQFNPMLNGLDFTPRVATLQVYTKDGQSQPAAQLKGVLSTPLVQISQSTLDIGAGRTGQTVSGSFTITNGGNLAMTINSYNLAGNDPGSFTLTPAPPFTLAPGASQIVTVTLNNNVSGSYSATGTLDATCNNVTYTLKAARANGGDIVQGTTHPITFAGGCRSNAQQASFQNISSKDKITLVSVAIVAANGWNDVADFSLPQPIAQQDVPPGAKVIIPVQFTPTGPGLKKAALQFTMLGKGYKGADSTWSESAMISGTGASVQRTVGVGQIGAVQQYHARSDNSVQFPLVIDQAIDAAQPNNGSPEIDGYKFTVAWSRDAFHVNAITAPNAGIVLTRIDSSFNAATGTDILTYQGTSPVPINGVTTLANFDLSPRVSRADSTPIAISNIQWLVGKTPVCYVANTVQSANFVLDAQCGSITLQHNLNGDDPAIYLQSIEPNPVHASAKITIAINGATNTASIQLYDVMGNQVAEPLPSQPLAKGTYAFGMDVRRLESGTYFLRVSDGQRTVTRPMTISK